MFTAFLIVAVWLLDLPLWLKIVLTVFGSIRVLYDLNEDFKD